MTPISKLFRHQLIFSSLLAGLSTSPTMAQSLAGVYVGGALSNTALTTVSGPSGTSQDGSKTGVKAFAGYQFTDNFGIELAYSQASSLRQAYIANNAKAVKSGNATIVSLSGTGRYAITSNFYLGGKLGIAQIDFSGPNPVPSGNAISGSSSGLIAGIGLEYKVSPTFSLVAGYDYLPRPNSRLVRNQAIGVKFTF
jgi:OmpA-OmpF porin, OOP family